MSKRHFPLFASAVLLACATFASVTSAQEQQQQGGQVRGERGRAAAAGVVNLADLARQEKLSPAASAAQLDEPVTIHSPRRMADDLPVDEALAVREPKSATSRAGAPRDPLVPSPGTDASFLGSDNLGVIPPDTHGAAGPNHLVVAVNGRLRVQTRDGAVLSTVTLSFFFDVVLNINVVNSAFDPRVFYDPLTGRFILVAVADSRSPDSSILVAVTQGPDPTAGWNVYQVDADPANQLWADYPSVGFNKDWIVVQVNMFPTNLTPTPAPPFTSNIYAFDKAKLMAGGPGEHRKFSIPDTGPGRIGGTQVPAVTFDPTLATLYLVNNWSSAAGSLRLFSITGPVGSEVLNTNLPQPVASENWSAGPGGDFGPQLDSTRLVQNNDQRIQSAVYRHGSLWCAQTIFLPGGGQPLRSAVQWWEINPQTGQVVQRGRVDDPTGAVFHAFPSIAVNKDRDVLVGYSRFSHNQYVSANYSFRAASDPPGTLRDSVVLKAGEGPYERTNSGTANRWGDYSASMVDPANDTDFWTIQEYAAAPTGTGAQTGRYGVWWGRVAPTGATPAPAVSVHLNSGATASEAAGSASVTVTRTGDLAAAAYVDYATANGTASDREDYLTAFGTLRFAPGESQKTVTVFLVNDAHAEAAESFDLALTNPRNCVLATPALVSVQLTSDDAAGAPNPVREATFDANFFVRQHYLDFFNREPDAAGLAFWTNQITECETRPVAERQECREVRRINVSGAFFLSVEFQQTGYLVYKTFGASYGTARVGSTVPLALREFLPDTQRIGRGVIVNATGWEQLLETNKRAFFDEFVLRPEFTARYPSFIPSAVFVDELNRNAGGALSQTERDLLVNDLNSTAKTRAQVLRAVAEDADFDAREKNRAFVLMQYFGYLRRNPYDAPELNLDFGGYNFWLQKLNDAGGNHVTSEMVKSFLVSGEYLVRFGP